MRVYFNLVDAFESIPDLDGLDIEDVDHACKEAEKAIAEILQEDASMRAHAGGWRLRAVDSSGAVLFSIDFNSIID